MLIDTHVHTIYSKHWFWGFDSLNKPRELVKTAIKKGLDGLAVTDHNDVRGSLATKKIAKDFKGFKVITGSEIRTLFGDLLALGIKENIPQFMSVEETVEKIHEAGGIAIAPHPFGKYVFRKCLEEKSLKTDAIEVYNASLLNFANMKAFNLAKRFKMPKTAGSDAHGLREVGNGAIICFEDPIEAILKKRVKIFTRKTKLRDVANLTARKFIRSIEWRISRRRGKYIHNPLKAIKSSVSK